MSEWMEMVGKFSDREVARRFGVSASKVRRYRLKTKISYCVNPEIPDGLADGMISMTNYQLCRKFGVSMARISELRLKLEVPEPRLEREKWPHQPALAVHRCAHRAAYCRIHQVGPD